VSVEAEKASGLVLRTLRRARGIDAAEKNTAREALAVILQAYTDAEAERVLAVNESERWRKQRGWDLDERVSTRAALRQIALDPRCPAEIQTLAQQVLSAEA
jgi:hypothetical protein